MDLDWDTYFMMIAYASSMKSKDMSTKHGSVIVGKDNEIKSTGYNGFPRGIDYSEEKLNRPLKYIYTEHAERNAIANLARIGVSSLGCKMYITGMPCSDCVRMIIQSGISEVIVHIDNPFNSNDRWSKNIEISEQMLIEAGVKLNKWSGKIPNLLGFTDGEEFKLC